MGKVQAKVKATFTRSPREPVAKPLGVFKADRKGSAQVELVGKKVRVTFLDRKDRRPTLFERSELPAALRDQIDSRVRLQEREERSAVWKSRREKASQLAAKTVDFLEKASGRMSGSAVQKPSVGSVIEGVRLAGKPYTYRVRFLPDGMVKLMRPKEKPGKDGKLYAVENWKWADLPPYARQQLSILSNQQQGMVREQQRVKQQVAQEAQVREKARLMERKRLDAARRADMRREKWNTVKEKAKSTFSISRLANVRPVRRLLSRRTFQGGQVESVPAVSDRTALSLVARGISAAKNKTRQLVERGKKEIQLRKKETIGKVRVLVEPTMGPRSHYFRGQTVAVYVEVEIKKDGRGELSYGKVLGYYRPSVNGNRYSVGRAWKPDRKLRAAAKEELSWVTPKNLREELIPL